MELPRKSRGPMLTPGPPRREGPRLRLGRGHTAAKGPKVQGPGITTENKRKGLELPRKSGAPKRKAGPWLGPALLSGERAESARAGNYHGGRMRWLAIAKKKPRARANPRAPPERKPAPWLGQGLHSSKRAESARAGNYHGKKPGGLGIAKKKPRPEDKGDAMAWAGATQRRGGRKRKGRELPRGGECVGFQLPRKSRGPMLAPELPWGANAPA